MKRHLAAIAVVAGCVLPAARVAIAAGDFESAKALYANASYEEALAALDHLEGPADPMQVNQYRALCLLALGKTREAEAPLQLMVATNPAYTIDQDSTSPRLVDLFRDVRKRTLPLAIRQLYNRAKASYDAKHHVEAAAQFKTLLEIVKDPDVADRAADMVDLKDLAEGFLVLAETQLALKPPVPAPSVPAPQSAALTVEPTAPALFSSADRDVKPPVEIERRMPRWTPTSALERQRGHRGVLRVVIDEQGRVETASLATAMSPNYDAELLQVARTWRYLPAMRQGIAVKYVLVLEIVLRAV
jgi:TonB family protein